MSWASIFAGAFMAFAVYFLLTLLGAAIGLTVHDQVEGDNFATGAAIWAVLTVALALFVGGYITSQSAVGENKFEAMVHGVIMWGLLFSGIMFLAGTGARWGFGALASLANTGAQANANSGGGNWQDALRRANISDDEIQKLQGRMDEALKNLGQAGREVVNNPTTRDQAAATATQAAWWSLAGVLLSMATAIAGALAGSGPSPHFVALMGRNRVTHQTTTGSTGGTSI